MNPFLSSAVDNIPKEPAPFATWTKIRADAARMGLAQVRLSVHGRGASERVVSFAFVCAQAELETA